MKSSNNKPLSKKFPPGRTQKYPEEDYQCLIRAVSSGRKDSKKREIATLVPGQAFLKFHQSMSTIMKVRGGGWYLHAGTLPCR